LKERLLREALQNEDSLVRFWAVIMVGRMAERAGPFAEIIVEGLADESWPTRRAFAEVVLQKGDGPTNEAQQILEEEVFEGRTWPERLEKGEEHK
jgi:HEAT repeat protein